MRASIRLIGLGLALTAGLDSASCLEPTEVKIVITTDLPCEQIHGARVAIGSLGALDTATESATTDACDPSVTPHSLGSIVLVPSGEPGAVGVEVVGATSGALDSCSALTPAGCIIARRSLRYLAHTPLTLPIALDGACVGIACAPDQTCVDGICKNATIADPSTCASATGCDQGGLTDIDGGAADAGGGAVAVAAGGVATCAIDKSGHVKCWGLGVGDGTSMQRNTPVDVVGLPAGVQSVSVGATAVTGAPGTACAVLATGGLVCWGANSSGQIGDGTMTDRLQPVAVSGLGSGVKQVAVGLGHACALMTTGSIKCWGLNGQGQLGDGTFTLRTTPVAPKVSGFASAIATGDAHTCAVFSGGAIACWGFDLWGQLGDGTSGNGDQANVPRPVKNVSLALDVSGGERHGCALLPLGVQCWGDDSYGELGDNGSGLAATAVNVFGISVMVKSISTMGQRTCALLPTSTVQCWGQSNLGDGTSNSHNVPTDVAGLSGVVQVSTGLSHSCAVLGTGAIMCWGSNANGQLGDGTTTDHLKPAPVVGFP